MEKINDSISDVLLSYDITEVKRVYDTSDVNKLLKQGWKLILTFAGDVSSYGYPIDIYILGKPSKEPQ